MANKTTIKTDKNGQYDYHQDRQKWSIRLPSGPTKWSIRLSSRPTEMVNTTTIRTNEIANKTTIRTDKNGQ